MKALEFKSYEICANCENQFQNLLSFLVTNVCGFLIVLIVQIDAMTVREDSQLADKVISCIAECVSCLEV